jgi:cytochrome c-type biogenesis protein CcmH
MKDKRIPLSGTRVAAAAALVLLCSAISFGIEQSAAAREIEDMLVAPCCWSQPVSQHDSQISQQIRTEVNGLLASGKSRDEIIDIYVKRYGERILVVPRAKGFNILAYILPWIALPLGAGILILLLRKLRSPAPAPASVPQPLPDSRFNAVIEKEMKELDE